MNIPTAASINALPDWVRSYIHDLEARADPTGDVQARAIQSDQIAQLTATLQSLREERDAAIAERDQARAEAGVGWGPAGSLIACAARMPQRNGRQLVSADFLVVYEGGPDLRCHTIAYWSFLREVWMSKYTGLHMENKVTHWMPLPEPPPRQALAGGGGGT